MKIAIIISLFTILLINESLSGQNSDLIITDIGGLFADNFIAFDGGLDHLELKVIREHANIKNQKIRLKGQVKSNESPYAVYNIFVGYEDLGNNKLIITDTIYSFDFEDSVTILNRKKMNQSANGTFKIKAKLKSNQALYIHSVGCCMIEIKLEEHLDE